LELLSASQEKSICPVKIIFRIQKMKGRGSEVEVFGDRSGVQSVAHFGEGSLGRGSQGFGISYFPDFQWFCAAKKCL
jgi:hypothetical protein